MRVREQLGTIRLNVRDTEVYRGYLIRTDPVRGCFHVSKHGHHITTRDTLTQARADVDSLNV